MNIPTDIATDIDTGDIINTSTACKILGISAKTLRRWCQDGFLSYYTTMGGHKRFSLKDIRDLLEKNHIKINS